MVDLRAGVRMIEPAAGLRRLKEFPFHLLTWVGADGYPLSAAVEGWIEGDGSTVHFTPPAGVEIPLEGEVSLTGSHIRPQPGVGYDERRHVTVWGRAIVEPGGRLAFRPHAAWGWDESDIPFPEYVERQVGQSRRYLARLSAEVGPVSYTHLTLPTICSV